VREPLPSEPSNAAISALSRSLLSSGKTGLANPLPCTFQFTVSLNSSVYLNSKIGNIFLLQLDLDSNSALSQGENAVTGVLKLARFCRKSCAKFLN
jgi:hypothetical protein